MIMIDTDIVIDILRKYKPAENWLTQIKDENLALSGFVKVELLQGCKKKSEQIKIDKVLSGCTIIWPSEQTCIRAYEIFSEYQLSRGIGIIDALIGMTAATYDLQFYTFNEKHYKFIPDIKLSRPYKKK